VDNDPTEPRVEAIGVSQSTQVPPRPYEDLLRGVPCVALVTEDRHRGPEGLLEPSFDEDREGSFVP
jgi:hypothetical protein